VTVTRPSAIAWNLPTSEIYGSLLYKFACEFIQQQLLHRITGKQTSLICNTILRKFEVVKDFENKNFKHDM